MTGQATAWNPDANSFIHRIATNGNRVIASGEFSTIGGETRNRIASLDPVTGTADSWNPNPNTPSVVNALAFDGENVRMSVALSFKSAAKTGIGSLPSI